MQNIAIAMLLLVGCVALASCKSGGGGLSVGGGESNSGSSGSTAPTVPLTETRAGKIYRQEIPVAATGDTMVVQVFEPTQLVAGQTYPLVLQGHGYGGSRETTAPDDSFIKRLIDAGYYVISIDERGFGESSGQVRVMDPEYEGQDLIAMLDWAENLPGLRRRANGQMMVGSYGGSYGGMYQVLLYSVDPLHRLRVMAPDITPHDLTYSLDPHNVVKSGWGLALIGGGELPLLGVVTGGNPLDLVTGLVDLLERANTRQDPAILEILLNAGLSNNFPVYGLSFMKYHSFAYFCDGQPAGSQAGFLIGRPDALSVPPTLPPPADVMLTQGFRDTLFNFNDGYNNYQCFKRIAATNQDGNGFGDVRLLTHQSGHILPLSVGTAGLEDPLDPFYAALTLPGFQDAGGKRACGSINLNDAQFAWFQEKLNGVAGAIDKVITTGDDVCLSLADDDAIGVEQVKVGGQSFAIDDSTPQLNSLLGLVGSLLGNAVRDNVLLADQLLYTVPESGGVIAGIPTLDLTMAGLTGAEQAMCTTDLVQIACDPILFLAIGHRPTGQTRWDIIDDQITPVRGFGEHKYNMNGIAERLQPGEQVALLIYAFNLQYPVTWSRDVLVPAMQISGSVQLPLLGPEDIDMTLAAVK